LKSLICPPTQQHQTLIKQLGPNEWVETREPSLRLESAVGADVRRFRPRKLNLLGRPSGTPKFAHNIASYREKSVVYLSYI
jgi:hypothetical protein